jgi:hypothetical protein
MEQSRLGYLIGLLIAEMRTRQQQQRDEATAGSLNLAPMLRGLSEPQRLRALELLQEPRIVDAVRQSSEESIRAFFTLPPEWQEVVIATLPKPLTERIDAYMARNLPQTNAMIQRLGDWGQRVIEEEYGSRERQTMGRHIAEVWREWWRQRQARKRGH